MRARASRSLRKRMFAQASRKQILTQASRKAQFATFSVQYNNNGFYIAHDSCHLFTGPTLTKQKDIILDLSMRKNGTIGVDSSAYTALRCHVSVMLLCLFAFRRFLPLTKTKTVPQALRPDFPESKKNTILGFTNSLLLSSAGTT